MCICIYSYLPPPGKFSAGASDVEFPLLKNKVGTTLRRDNLFYHSRIVPIDEINIIFYHTIDGLNAY